MRCCARPRSGKLREARRRCARRSSGCCTIPKARRFTENFTGQWLSCGTSTPPCRTRSFTRNSTTLLEWTMVRETQRFFDELLTHDLSLLELHRVRFHHAQRAGSPSFTASRAWMGRSFRKVALSPEDHRGGVLTQASVLKVTANGTNTSPVVRGAWFLRNIVGRPALPPPPNMPAIEPDTRGATTIRAQLDKHRSVEMCATCHNRIDPPGAALENFDVIGGWRETTGARRGPATSNVRPADGKSGRFKHGPPVRRRAATLRTAGSSRTSRNSKSSRWRRQPDQFARCLAEKLLVYATGHSLDFADRAGVTEIVRMSGRRTTGFARSSMRSSQSPTFLNK